MSSIAKIEYKYRRLFLPNARRVVCYDQDPLVLKSSVRARVREFQNSGDIRQVFFFFFLHAPFAELVVQPVPARYFKKTREICMI